MTDRPIKNKYIMISEKLSKAAKSVIPIVAVVLVLSLTIAPIPDRSYAEFSSRHIVSRSRHGPFFLSVQKCL